MIEGRFQWRAAGWRCGLAVCLGWFLFCLPEARGQVSESKAGTAVGDLNRERRNRLTESEREAIRQKAAAMTPEQRAALREKYRRFKALPDAERDKIRRNRGRMNELSPEQRERMKRRHERLRQMTPEERARFRQDLAQKRQLRRERQDMKKPSGASGQELRKPRGGQEERQQRLERFRQLKEERNRDLGNPAGKRRSLGDVVERNNGEKLRERRDSLRGSGVQKRPEPPRSGRKGGSRR